MAELSNAERLANEFIRQSGIIHSDVKPTKVLKARVFQIAHSNVLIRAASEGNRRYFFGINYITIEEMANLDNPFIAFVCGSINKTIIIPARVLFKELNSMSHDRNGEYKINIDKNLDIVLKGRGNRLDCTEFINNWDILKRNVGNKTQNSTVEESLHTVLQGRLIEIGNIRGFRTYSPNKTKKFNDRSLSEFTTLSDCPNLQFSDYELLRQIDVLWFKEKGSNLIPQSAFEVELSTGTWPGVGRMSTLLDYNNVCCYVISNNKKKYKQVINTFPVIKDRFRHIDANLISELYSSEFQLQDLRTEIGL